MEWIIANKEWLFSGVGIALISSLIWLFRSKREKNSNPNNSQLVSHVTGGGDVHINQTISKNDDAEKQVHITFMSLKQMPGRLQESINSGATEFSFNEARKEIETLYAIASADKKNDGLKNTLIEFQDRFNNYIKLINQAIAKKVTLDKVNQYHKKEVVDWFAENILNKKT